MKLGFSRLTASHAHTAATKCHRLSEPSGRVALDWRRSFEGYVQCAKPTTREVKGAHLYLLAICIDWRKLKRAKSLATKSERVIPSPPCREAGVRREKVRPIDLLVERAYEL